MMAYDDKPKPNDMYPDQAEYKRRSEKQDAEQARQDKASEREHDRGLRDIQRQEDQKY